MAVLHGVLQILLECHGIVAVPSIAAISAAGALRVAHCGVASVCIAPSRLRFRRHHSPGASRRACRSRCDLQKRRNKIKNSAHIVLVSSPARGTSLRLPAAGERPQPFDLLLTRYVLESPLYRFNMPPHRDRFVPRARRTFGFVSSYTRAQRSLFLPFLRSHFPVGLQCTLTGRQQCK